MEYKVSQGFSTLNIVQLTKLDKRAQRANELEKRIVTIENSEKTNGDQFDFASYYDMIDQKADNALKKVVAIVSTLLTVVTLFSGLSKRRLAYH